MRRIALLLVLTLSLLSSCAPQPLDCARPQVFCVGLVTDYGSTDSGIAHEAWLGLQDLRNANVVERIDKIETVDARDRAANIQYFAHAGYDVIVTVGASMAKETTRAASEYSNLSFIGVEQPQQDVLPNLSGLVFHEENAGFLAGALAALMTQTGHVAGICESDFVEPMRRYCEGFQAGARHVTPKIDATIAFRDGPSDKLFNDPDWGRKAALDALNNGADVVFAAGGTTAAAALQAAAGQGAYVIGAETDLYGSMALIRQELLTSATSDVRSGVVKIVRALRGNEFPSGQTYGDVKLAPWHDLDRQVPKDVKNQITSIAQGLNDGTLKNLVPYEKPEPAATAGPSPTPTP
jgi:basic membrane protein A